MSLEERLHQLADGIGGRLQDAVAAHLRAFAEQVTAEAAGERERAVAEARELAAAEVREQADRQREAALAEAREQTRQEQEAAGEQARQAHETALQDARAEHEAALRQAHEIHVAATDERDAAVAERAAAVAEALVEERQAELACTERLLDFIRHADHAATLSQVLDALAEYAGGEAGRSALFVAKGLRLRLWRVVGLDQSVALPDGFSLAADDAGILSDTLRSGRPAARPTGADERLWAPGLAAFGLGAGRVGLALPVIVGGSVVAVLYVDEGDDGRCTPSAWPELIEVAARHAGRCLDVLTAARAALLRRSRPFPAAEAPGGSGATRPARTEPAEVDEEAARRHARLLISEIRLYNESTVVDGRRAGDIRERLANDIERARRLYEARIPDSVASRDRVFEDELVRTLADGDSGLMGQAT